MQRDKLIDEERYGGLVKSAARVFEILELFDAQRRALKISEIVEGLSLPQSSVSTLMKSLVSLGYVEFDEDSRRFRPTVRLALLGHWSLGASDSLKQVQDLMRALADETTESVLLGAQKGLHLQYLSFIESLHNLRFTLRPGQIRPLHGCGLGIMLLSTKPDDEIRRIIERWKAENGPGDATPGVEETLERVALCREQGYFETYGMVTEGVGTISTVLPPKVGGQYLGIALGGPIARLDTHREELRDALMRAARSFTGGDPES